MDRLLRWLPDGHPALESGVATLAGFLAGLALRDEWPLVEWLWRVLLGG